MRKFIPVLIWSGTDLVGSILLYQSATKELRVLSEVERPPGKPVRRSVLYQI
ncbi:MAG: hypothetical protein ACK4TA_21025 [Saprospiraceae bacterium]